MLIIGGKSIIVGGNGGLYISQDGGLKKWKDISNLSVQDSLSVICFVEVVRK